MNFSLTSSTMNSNNHFLQSKLNNASTSTSSSSSSNQHYLNQQQSNANLAPRFMNLNPAAAQFTSLSSPTLSAAQISKQSNSLGLGQSAATTQSDASSFNLQRNFQLNSFYPMNLNLNQSNPAAAAAAASLQQISNPTLLASVLAANTTCSLNNTLFVGNLHASLQEMDLVQVFRPFGRIVECCKKWLHFGFVKFTSEEEACHAYVTLNGFRLKGRPMRLEFQNRTKKARIKAILAQAALQANTSPAVEQVDSSAFSGLSFSNFLSENQSLQFSSSQQPLQSQASSSAATASSASTKFDQFQSTNDCTFFDADQLMKFANTQLQADLDLEPKMKKFSDDFNQLCSFEFNDDYFKSKSMSDSPNHDNSCALSSSSDSGCRSTSSLAEEDSGIASLQSKSSKVTLNKLTPENLKQLDEENNKKHMKTLEEDESDDDDDDDCVSNSDTSDDASEIPSETDSLDLLDDLDSLDACQECTLEPSKKYNQIIEKDGTLVRKKLEYGIYRSINHTFSLFIEPQDILKKLDSDEYDEYVLFPNGIDNMLESYFSIKNANRLIA